jgi:Spy/CpxP family protein refolding chaperone
MTQTYHTREITTRLMAMLCLVVTATLGPTSSIAEERQVDPAALEARVAEMRQRLSLTDEQSEQIKPILIEHLEKISTVLQGFGINIETGERPENRLGFRDARKLKSELDEVRDETSQSLSTILSPEQMKEYEEISEERREEMRSRIKEQR